MTGDSAAKEQARNVLCTPEDIAPKKWNSAALLALLQGRKKQGLLKYRG
jgi:hypothetical protein